MGQITLTASDRPVVTETDRRMYTTAVIFGQSTQPEKTESATFGHFRSLICNTNPTRKDPTC